MTPRRRPTQRPIRLSAAPSEGEPPAKRRRARRIGLFGGSFNPAHEGHLHISRAALRSLALDEVWWLVSPQNPLKSSAEMAPLADRVRTARHMARDRRIKVSTFEVEHGLTFTADTIKALRRRFPRARFVWLMGADNLPGFTRWRRWVAIYQSVPIAIFARHPYAPRVHASVPSLRFIRQRIAARRARRLAERAAPAWAFLHCRLHAGSATAIRAAGRGRDLNRI